MKHGWRAYAWASCWWDGTSLLETSDFPSSDFPGLPCSHLTGAEGCCCSSLATQPLKMHALGGTTLFSSLLMQRCISAPDMLIRP